MNITKLLFVTKFNDLSYNALQSIIHLRDVALEHVVFAHVIEREKVAMHRGLGYQKKEELKLRETANIRFIDWAEHLFEQGMEVGVYIVVGKEAPDVIVIGRSHKGLIDQLYTGSDITEIVRQANIPVLIYKPPMDKTELMETPFERPLLATDWSPASMLALEYLLPLKGVAKKVDVIHVASDKDLTGSAMEMQKVRKRSRTKLEEMVDRLVDCGIEARAHVYVGDVEEEIERAARDCQASMIVMGSSGKSAWAERWLGSTPRIIAEKSPYATFIVPLPKTSEQK
jgi:nucleotide-binding universal stress UspA family protein